MTPSEDESDKLLLAAKKSRKATSTEFLISLVADDFSRASSTYVGKIRSNFLGTKFIMYDSQPPNDESFQANHSHSSRRFHTKQISPRIPAFNYSIATITYSLNVLRTRGPRRINCSMHYIPVSSIQQGGTAPTPKSLSSPSIKQNQSDYVIKESLVLKNKSPRWHEQLQCWCLNFKGRVTVASVKNFQLGAFVEDFHDVSSEVRNKVILQFGKIGQDIFTMDYQYPLSAFQAFVICLSSFDTKPACE